MDTGSKPPGGHHTPPSATRLQHHHCTVTAGRTPPCHQAPLATTAWLIRLAPPGATAFQGLCCTIPLGETLPIARRPARTMTPITDLCPMRLAARSHRQASYQQRNATGFWHSNKSYWTSNHTLTKFQSHSQLFIYTTQLNYNTHI